MVLKNKDGSPFKLRSPNPLTKEQVLNDDWVLHNFDWKIITTEVKTIAPPTPPSLGVIENKPVEIKPKTPEPEPPKPVEEESEKHAIIVDRAQEKQRNLKNIVIFHCLPADPQGNYLNKFDFEGIFVVQEDLEVAFWTNVSINPGSIIFPYRYAEGGKKFMDYRWWKINKCLPKGKGFLIRAEVSDICPDFSD